MIKFDIVRSEQNSYNCLMLESEALPTCSLAYVVVLILFYLIIF